MRHGRTAPDDLITMINNLPVVDYSKTHNTRLPIQRCPTGAIVWLDDQLGVIKGAESKKIVRKGQTARGNCLVRTRSLLFCQSLSSLYNALIRCITCQTFMIGAELMAYACQHVFFLSRQLNIIKPKNLS